MIDAVSVANEVYAIFMLLILGLIIVLVATALSNDPRMIDS